MYFKAVVSDGSCTFTQINPIDFKNEKFQNYVVLSDKVIVSDGFTLEKDTVGSQIFLCYGKIRLDSFIEVIRGDISMDSKVNSLDALISLQITTKLIEPTGVQRFLADMNLDGKVTSYDALLILLKSVGKN